MKNIYVLDTNIILYDNNSIYNFGEHDVVIPISIVNELDHFKRGNEDINYHAREFIKFLDELPKEKLFDGGVEINDQKGKIRIKLEQKFHKSILENFPENSEDHKILNCALQLCKTHPNQTVILVSNDANMRIKAKALNIDTQTYSEEKAGKGTKSYNGICTIDIKDENIVNTIYSDSMIPYIEVLESEPIHNEYYISRSGSQSAITRYNSENKMLEKINQKTAYGINGKNSEQIIALDALLDPSIKLVTITGKAGTGKTLLALAAALECRSAFHQIFLARPIVPLSNKDMGFLPGTIHEKLDPYMLPLFDNLGVIKHQFKDTDKKVIVIKEMQEKNKLVISPLAYIRGRSLNNIYFIVDESQNLTAKEMKTIITRAGEGTKFVFTGDISQIDHPYLDKDTNGLSYIVDKLKGQKMYAHINLEKGERSKLSEMASNLL